MKPISGNKIFVLYSDAHLRDEIFYGGLRNSYTIYYMYDYEKVKALVNYYPGSLIVLNLVNNDLGWLPEELCSELSGLPDDKQPKIIAIYDEIKPLHSCCSRVIHYQGNDDDLRAELSSVFVDLGGKGRRNFVRYGGSGENVASIRLRTASADTLGIVHDISASGLSCGLLGAVDIIKGDALQVILSLDGKTLELDASKILERNFDGSIVHVLKFNTGMPADIIAELLGFIYKSLDSEMEAFIKNLSN